MEFSENFLFSSVQENGTVTNDLWESLRSCQKPVLLYGMGNGADKIIATCERKGIDICDCFASDGFVRGQLFHGRRVLSFSEAKDKYRDAAFVWLLFAGCHGQNPTGRQGMRALRTGCSGIWRYTVRYDILPAKFRPASIRI